MTETAARPSSRRLSVAHLLVVLPWVALVIDAWAPIRDNSFLWHIRAGALQIDAGSVLTTDPFSFTMFGERWLTQSWLGELLYSWGEDVTHGLGFVPWLLLVFSAITFLAMGLVAYERSRSLTSTAVVLMLSTVLFLPFLVPRPVIFSFALFALVLVAWERPDRRWALPFLFWIWASMHGSFAIGLAYVGLSLIARREWKWLPTALVSGLVTLATAHGLGVITMLTDFASARETLALLSEWRRPTLTSPVFIPFVIGGVIIVWGLVRKRLEWRWLWVALPFLALGATSLRAVPPAWQGLTPLVAASLGPIAVGTTRRLSRGPVLVFGAFVALFPLFLRGDGELSDTRFPIAASERLDDVRTFHDDRTGGYLIYADGPEFKVYIDDRAELYGERMAEFVGVRDGEIDWEPVFRRDGIEQVLMPVGASVVGELEEAGWSTTYEDDEFVVLRP